jgi:methylmalonyl-CoA mutase C-terminal domain/subunit
MRIVVAEPGLGRALRDAGHEVIYLGPDHSPEQVVATAIQEDADVVGLTAEDDADRITALLAELDADDIDVTVFPPGQPRAVR